MGGYFLLFELRYQANVVIEVDKPPILAVPCKQLEPITNNKELLLSHCEGAKSGYIYTAATGSCALDSVFMTDIKYYNGLDRYIIFLQESLQTVF